MERFHSVFDFILIIFFLSTILILWNWNVFHTSIRGRRFFTMMSNCWNCFLGYFDLSTKVLYWHIFLLDDFSSNLWRKKFPSSFVRFFLWRTRRHDMIWIFVQVLVSLTGCKSFDSRTLGSLNSFFLQTQKAFSSGDLLGSSIFDKDCICSRNFVKCMRHISRKSHLCNKSLVFWLR